LVIAGLLFAPLTSAEVFNFISYQDCRDKVRSMYDEINQLRKTVSENTTQCLQQHYQSNNDLMRCYGRSEPYSQRADMLQETVGRISNQCGEMQREQQAAQNRENAAREAYQQQQSYQNAQQERYQQQQANLQAQARAREAANDAAREAANTRRSNQTSQRIEALSLGANLITGLLSLGRQPASEPTTKYNAIHDTAAEALSKSQSDKTISKIQQESFDKIKEQHNQTLAQIDQLNKDIDSITSSMNDTSKGPTYAALEARWSSKSPGNYGAGQGSATNTAALPEDIPNPFATGAERNAGAGTTFRAIPEVNPFSSEPDQRSHSGNHNSNVQGTIDYPDNAKRFVHPQTGIEYVIPEGYSLYRSEPGKDLAIVRTDTVDSSAGDDPFAGNGCRPDGVGKVTLECEKKRAQRNKPKKKS
jgi:gas vesicle protein